MIGSVVSKLQLRQVVKKRISSVPLSELNRQSTNSCHKINSLFSFFFRPQTLPHSHPSALVGVIIQRKLLDSDVYKRSHRVGVYLSIAREVSTNLIVADLLASGTNIQIIFFSGLIISLTECKRFEETVLCAGNSVRKRNATHSRLFARRFTNCFYPQKVQHT